MEPKLVSSEVAAFRRHYDDLLCDVKDPVQLATLLCSDGVISSEVRGSITSKSIDVEKGRAVLGFFQLALLQSSEPSAMMRSLRRAFEKAGFHTFYSIRPMEEFVDGELYAISLIKTG